MNTKVKKLATERTGLLLRLEQLEMKNKRLREQLSMCSNDDTERDLRNSLSLQLFIGKSEVYMLQKELRRIKDRTKAEHKKHA